MSITQDFCNVFKNSWNENIDKFVNKYKIIANHNEIIIVNDNATIKTDSLSNLLLKCFYTVFNGLVCDRDHWEYYLDCLACTREKISAIPDDTEFLNTFIECWNENSNKFIKRVGDKYNGRPIIVISKFNDEVEWFELTPRALQCFYNTFNGSVCDDRHWNCFLYCLANAKKITGIDTETYKIRKTMSFYTLSVLSRNV